MNDQSTAWQHWFPLIENAVGDLSRCMFDQVGLASGHRVLDLATGIGEPALEAAGRVGPEGRVLGVDISPAMIDVALARAEAAGLTNAEFRVMDIEVLSLPESFDIVLSRCGLMFVDDLRATLGGIRRVLEPGGRISVSFWASGDETPTLSLAERTAHRVLGLPPPGEGEKTPFALCDVTATATALEEAGFADVRIQRIAVTFEFKSASQFVSYREALSSRFVAPMDGRSDRAREHILKAVAEAITPYQDADGTVRMENQAYCLSAVRP
ncbi:methyltransferase [Litchfieldella qijiaojingensis]|uniref:Methyltransferase n=1 Tax=Litchfieldella qijiaojingensis TaxID=980347 RepID=A0ABQ2ZFP3_9GAMM|nr:methyltransferase domain-containing protein [Halomonas qijiaojingensis]GGY11726.1 methyltransferase [Halomonas qijiaojingensis]